MLAIGRGLMPRPRLLLRYGRSLGRAPPLTAEIFAALGSLRAQEMTVVLVEQNVRAALACADYVYWLERGTILREGTPEALAAVAAEAAGFVGQPTAADS